MMWQFAHAFGSVERYESPPAYANVRVPIPPATPSAMAGKGGREAAERSDSELIGTHDQRSNERYRAASVLSTFIATGADRCPLTSTSTRRRSCSGLGFGLARRAGRRTIFVGCPFESE